MFHDAVEDVDGLSDEEEVDAVKTDTELNRLKRERVKVGQHLSKISLKKVRFISSPFYKV